MKTKLILDVHKAQYAQLNSMVMGRVGDKASNTVDVYVVDGFVPYNLTGSDVYFECAKPDNTSVRDKNGIVMIDAAKGHFEYTFPTQTFTAVGKSKQAYFTVEKNSTVKATTQDFIIVSIPDALTNRIPSQTYISQLEELIWQLEQIELDLLNSAAYQEAHNAKIFAEQAKLISESVKAQLDQIVIQGSIDPETKQARVDEKGTAYNTLKERIDADSFKINDLRKKTSYFVNVLEFGADPTGKTASTNAFRQAADYCERNRKNLRIPDGDFLIDGPLPFPNYYAIIGNGYYSNIIVNIPSGESVWKEPTSFKYGWGFDNFRLSLKEGASKDVGGIYIESSMRGAYIRNIWSYNLRTPLYLGDKIWGTVSVDNIFLFLLGENLDNTQSTAAFLAKGNTIMMSNIEIVGGWTRGLHLDGVSVFKLNGYNISGSSTSIQMSQAIYVESSDSGEITSGWIEQLVDNPSSANGRPVWNNGEGHAIYVKNSEAITIGETNVSTGSIYCDNSKITIDQIKYAQSNAGIKMVNNGRVNATESSIKTQNVGADFTKSDGEIILNTRATSGVGILDNPIMKVGIPHALTVTNGSLVSLSDESTDFISGDRAIKVTVSANYHGVFINKSNLKVGKLYTAVVKVKKVNGLDSISILSGTGTNINTKYPGTLTRSGTSEYHVLYFPFISTLTSVTIKVQGLLTSGQTSGVFLLDSADIFEGYNVYDPSQQNQSVLGEQGRLKANSAPTSGSWDVGNKISIGSPISNGYIGQVCIASGSPGTWKGYGQIIDDTDWTNLSTSFGSVGGRPMRYKKVNGTVTITGSVASATNGTTFATLPVGFRPIQDMVFPVQDASVSKSVELTIKGDGGMVLQGLSTNATVHMSATFNI